MTKAIILAAGQGSRMKSSLHKLMHPILGKTVIEYVVDAARAAGIGEENMIVVVSPGATGIQESLTKRYPQINFAVQETALGTGHAVQAAAGYVQDNDNVIILYGDMPLVEGEFIDGIVKSFGENKCAAMATALYAPLLKDFGRVFFDAGSMFEEIVEARDLTTDHRPCDWVNPGVFMFRGTALHQGLAGMKNDNSQGEYYLTDVPKIIAESGDVVRVFQTTTDPAMFTGINTQAQLAEAAGYMRTRINNNHMANGVRMIDPTNVYIDITVEIAQDTVVYPGVILEGACKIEKGAIVGVNTHMKDTILGEGAFIRQSVTDSAEIGAGTQVGPFAYLRPGTKIGKKCRVGNFVEIKNATLDDGAKMAHLAYIGDADVGKNVNYSCGAITANYDGKNKFRTTIKNNAFIGSNANLVAPVTIGEGAFVAAGSTITADLQDSSLGIARAKQVEKLNWKQEKA